MLAFFSFKRLLVFAIASINLFTSIAQADQTTHDQPADYQQWSAASQAAIASDFSATPAVTPSGPPQLLGEWSLDSNPNFNWGFATIMTKLDWLRISFGPSAGFSSGPSLFDNLSITTADVGKIFTSDASQNSSFNSIAQLLTNGSPSDTVFVATGLHSFGAAGANHPESYWAAINGAPADFSGYQITSIGILINNLTFTSPGSDPNHDGNWTNFTIERKLLFYGQPVPEPVTGVVVPMSVLLLSRKMRNRKSLVYGLGA